jgi:hypothetical protein
MHRKKENTCPVKKKRMFVKNYFILLFVLIFCTHAEIKDSDLRHAVGLLLDSRTLLEANSSSCANKG